MNGFLERLKEEQKELQIKLDGLANFINTDSFRKLSYANQELLHLQFSYMHDYNRVLKIRLEILTN